MVMVFPLRTSIAFVAAALAFILVVQPGSALQGGPDGSPQSYRFVDSDSADCAAPSVPDSTPAPSPERPNRGCPGPFEDISTYSWRLGYPYPGYYLEDYSYPYNYLGSFMPSLYGASAYYLGFNSNGFVWFPGCYMYGEDGTGGTITSQPQAMPFANPSNCAAGPANFVAGIWANMFSGYSYYGSDPCPDDPYDQGVYMDTSTSNPAQPYDHYTVQFHNMRVTNPSRPAQEFIYMYPPPPDPYQAAYCQQPHTFADFEVKIYRDGSYDALVRTFDSNGQAYAMGIMDSTGTYGLTYRSVPSGSTDTITDLGVRYYPDRPAQAKDLTIKVDEGDPVTGTLSAYDPDYQDIDTSAHGAGRSGRYDGIDHYDSLRLIDAATGDPTQGTIALAANGVDWTFTPPNNDLDWNGVTGFQYRAMSVDGSWSPWAKVSITVKPVNDAPTVLAPAPPVEYSIFPGEDLLDPAPGILGYVHDVEVARGETPTQTLTPTVVQDVDPDDGTLAIDAEGTVTFTPGTNMQNVGDTADFIFVVCDNLGLCTDPVPATITVTPAEGRLVAHSDPGYSLREDDALIVSVADGVLRNDIVAPDVVNPRVVVDRFPLHADAYAMNDDGSFVYRAASNWNGQDSFVYHIQADDGVSNRAAVRIVVRPVNDAPSFVTQYGDEWELVEDGPAVRLNNFIDLISTGPDAPDENAQMAYCRSLSPSPCFGYAVEPADFFTDPAYHTGPGIGKAPTFAIDNAPDRTVDLRFRPGRDRFGTATVTIWMDDLGGSADGGQPIFPSVAAPYVFKLIVSPVVDRPVAQADLYEVLRGQTVSRDAANGLLANDFDPDSLPFSLVQETFTGRCGTLSVAGDGSFTYVADKPVAGVADCTDQLTYHTHHSTSDPTRDDSIPVVATFLVHYNALPQAAFKANTYESHVGEGVSFTDQSFDTGQPGDPGFGIVAWNWDFSDGGASSKQNPVHAFDRPGLYPVRLTATDGSGDAALAEHVIHVTYAGDPSAAGGLASQYGDAPLAFAGPNLKATEGDIVVLHGSSSPESSPERPIYAQWVQESGPDAGLVKTDGLNLTFTAPNLGGRESAVVTLALVVADDTRASAPSRVQVTVMSANRAPSAIATAPAKASAGALVTLDASGSSDPDGNTLTYRWEQLSGEIVPIQLANTPKATFNMPAASGPLEFQVTVDDGARRSTALVHVEPLAATATAAGFSYNVAPGSRLVTFAALAPGSAFTWDFGDGTPQVQGASVQHVFSAPGTFTVRLDAAGASGATSYSSPVILASPARSAPGVSGAATSAGAPAWMMWAAGGLGVAVLGLLLVASRLRKA